MILFSYTDNSGILLGDGESRYPSLRVFLPGAWFASLSFLQLLGI